LKNNNIQQEFNEWIDDFMKDNDNEFSISLDGIQAFIEATEEENKMENPCKECLVRASCDHSKHCQEWYEYENKMVVSWIQKEAGRVLDKNKGR